MQTWEKLELIDSKGIERGLYRLASLPRFGIVGLQHVKLKSFKRR
jgi:hypothetical protein